MLFSRFKMRLVNEYYNGCIKFKYNDKTLYLVLLYKSGDCSI